ncbi:MULTISPECIES: lytic transglycosylase domain-containing protein [unclassified Paenibacillus]|uniref:lytic transglycosylase domain-containing protein n=1 Tax=unclassified Paenibacillus TaxID=185978 RepID=UPI001AE4768E|nr:MULTISPECIES: lytic transglycosylase domain-containing protein [unclassified Paenibacillus]MBP1154632.1 soluble lytic murein transglycosylase [Paenibacillus sp. PvP091]MBP1169984.1 soluble lytic murein transglycosylase [Paenibacillus sp. PvR098]MBP2441012.1 soluble lytic murein transglycosylase [Paenibacillus sp. PvP052]
MSFWRKKRVFALLLLTFLLFLFLGSNVLGRILYPIQFEQEIRQSAQKYQLDPFLIAAVIRVETNYRTDVTSNKGAYGLMQLMPDTSDWIIEKASFPSTFKNRLDDPAVSIELGSWYLNWMYKQFDGNTFAVLAGYNAGHGKVSRWLQEGQWDGTLDNTDQIPYGETKRYVQRVTYYYDKYYKTYAEDWEIR